MKQAEWMKRYRQQFIEAAEVSPEVADDCAKAAPFEEISAHFESDPEGAADMEMSYWDD